MKKLFLLAFAFFGILNLIGCSFDETIEELLPPGLEMEESPVSNILKEFYFDSLMEGEDPFVAIREPQSLGIKTPGYDNQYIAVAMYAKDCEVCKAQAPYLDRAAKEFPKIGMDIVIMFTDVYDDQDSDVEWIKDLSYVKSYKNSVSFCSENGICQEVFLPFSDMVVGNIYFVNKKNVQNRLEHFTWNTTQDQEELYQNMREAMGKHIGAKTIQFDPSVEDWKDDENVAL